MASFHDLDVHFGDSPFRFSVPSGTMAHMKSLAALLPLSLLVACASPAEPARTPPPAAPPAAVPPPAPAASSEAPEKTPARPAPPKEGDLVYPGGATGRDARGVWKKGESDPWAKGTFIAREPCPTGVVTHTLVLNGSEATINYGGPRAGAIDGRLEFGTSTSGLPARARFVKGETLLGYVGGEGDFAVLDGPNVGFACHDLPEMVFVRAEKEAALTLTSFVHPKGFRFVYPAAMVKATSVGDVGQAVGTLGSAKLSLRVKRIPGIVRAVRPPPPDTERTPPEEIDQAVRYDEARGFRVGGTKTRSAGTEFRQVLTLPLGPGLVEAVCEVDASSSAPYAPHLCRLMLQSIELH